MNYTVELSPEIYQILRHKAEMLNATPKAVVEDAVRQLYDNRVYIKQRQTAHGLQAYIRGTRVAVRHVIGMMRGGHTLDEIISTGLPHIPTAAIYEAVAYYQDHRNQIDAELEAEKSENANKVLADLLTPEQVAQLTGKSA